MARSTETPSRAARRSLEMLARAMRGAIGNLRAAAETLELYPGATPERRARLFAVLAEESNRLAGQIETLERLAAGEPGDALPPEPSTLSRLLAGLATAAHAAGLATETDEVDPPEASDTPIAADLEPLIEAASGLLAEIRSDLAVASCRLSARATEGQILVDISWRPPRRGPSACSTGTARRSRSAATRTASPAATGCAARRASSRAKPGSTSTGTAARRASASSCPAPRRRSARRSDAMDPVDFLSGHSPFSDLSEAGRRELGRGLEVLWARSGDRLLDRERPNAHLYAVRKGSVRLELDGQLVDAIGPGEVFGLTSVLGGESPSLDAVAERDCLLYRIHRDVVRSLFGEEPRFASFFMESLGSRLRALADGAPVPLAGDLGVPVGDLISRPPVTVGIDADVLTAARQMDRERVSSVLVLGEAGADGAPARPVGILTDRDLRGRVLAAGRGPETPVREVMSSPLETMDATLPTSEALLHLLRQGIHHLPIEREGEVIGVVAHTDLLRHQRHGPGALLKKIEKTPDAAGLAGYADDVAAMVESLHRGGLEATEIGRLVAALNDALISRLLDLAQREIGSAPCDFAWIVFGSEGRQEQSFLTDQDNALVYADGGGEAAADYFARLAKRAVDDLVTVGFPLCAGGSWRPTGATRAPSGSSGSSSGSVARSRRR